MDYTSRFGENYKKLVHIITRDKQTQVEETKPLNEFIIPLQFNSFEKG
jgi:hypothetical protein